MNQLHFPGNVSFSPELPTELRIACDTEFQGAHTLTIQFAARIGNDIAVQVYRSPAIPEMPKFDLVSRLPRVIRDHCSKVVLRKIRPITAGLSPVQIVSDLYGIEGFEQVVQPSTSQLGFGGAVMPITLTLIAHFWTADFFRVFGADFWRELMRKPTEDGNRIVIQDHRSLAFKKSGQNNNFRPPVLCHGRIGATLYPICVRTLDTMLPFGASSLDELCKTFLGVTKAGTLAKEDMCQMLSVFNERPEDAFYYAAQDCVLTLRLDERMREFDHKMYVDLGFDINSIPEMRPTLGGRVSEMITRAVASHAVGSVMLSQRGIKLKSGRIGPISMQRIRSLLKRGSSEQIGSSGQSRFGLQTGDTHGGLLFSRSPTQFFHEGVGQFADVDLAGCYAAIIAGINLYAGRPIVLEPGSRRMSLAEAVTYLEENAAGPDAWIVKVTGDINGAPNALIPSTRGAITNANFNSRTSRKREKFRTNDFGANLFTNRIEAGIIAWPTWLMIQALPEGMRREYEQLEVDTVIFYARQLVADNGAAYDTKFDSLSTVDTPWSSEVNLEALRKITVEQFDSNSVSLRFPLKDLARKFSDFRREACAKHGKGSGADLAWKQQANTIYGVLASRFHVTNNVVAANIITATGRSIAFAMQQSLNGFQVITDGCIYRRDQVPAGTFAECIAAQRDYPINRTGFRGPFVDPASIPTNDDGFTSWYRAHVKRYFGVGGPEYDKLFGTHELAHKNCGTSEHFFDGLCCDGSANYIKLTRNDGSWKPLEFKARSYRKPAKEILAPWLIQTYSNDDYDGPPPPTETGGLLSYKDALIVARSALKYIATKHSDQHEQDQDAIEVVLPVGLEKKTMQTYKVIKVSQFLFRDPVQRTKFERALQKFADSTGTGLEALSLRRRGGKRPLGSIQAIAQALYDYIRAGGDNPTKAFNLTRDFSQLREIQNGYHCHVIGSKHKLKVALFESIRAQSMDSNAALTGMFVCNGDPMFSE